jgi:hypothetical protein
MIRNFKLLNLKLANSGLIIKRVIEENLSHLLIIASQIKKVLRVIYQYHINKKRILFIGNPLYVNAKLARMLKKTKHVFIPRGAWVAGHIADRFARATQMTHKKSKIKLFSIRNLKKKSHLVVIIDRSLDFVALKEHHSAKIPIVALNDNTKMFNETGTYKVSAKLAYLRSELAELLFYSLLVSVFKKAGRKNYKYYSKRYERSKLRIKGAILGNRRTEYRNPNSYYKKN